MDGGHSESNRGSFFQRARSRLKYRGSFFQRARSWLKCRGSFFQRARSCWRYRGSFFQRVRSRWGYRGSFFQRVCSCWRYCGSFFQRARSRWGYRGSFFQRLYRPAAGARMWKDSGGVNECPPLMEESGGGRLTPMRCHLLSSSISLIVSLSKPRSWAILKR